MSTLPDGPKPRDSWGACVRAWLVAWLMASALVAVFLIVVLAVNAMRFGPAADSGTPIAGSMRGFEAMLLLVVAPLHAIAIALALLVALPLQATALRLRRAGASAETLAGVAALTSLSAVLSFLVLYALNRPMVQLVAPPDMLLALVLVAAYLAHAGILLIARRRMGRRDVRAVGDRQARSRVL